MNTELKNTASVIVLITSGRIWAQGDTIEAAQTEADNAAGCRQEWTETRHLNEADFGAYRVPAGDYDGLSRIPETAEFLGYWSATEAAPARLIDISSVRLAKSSETPMVEFRTRDGRSGAECLDQDGYVETGWDSRLWRVGVAFSDAEIKQIHAELAEITTNDFEFTDVGIAA